MSQATNFSVPLIGPVTPAAMASRIDESFSALLSGHSGSGRPAYAVDGTVWMSTATAGQRKYYLYDGTADRLLFTVVTATGEVTFNFNAIQAIANGAGGASDTWGGRLLQLQNLAPSIFFNDLSGGTQNALVGIDSSAFRVYSTPAADGSGLTARFSINLIDGTVTLSTALPIASGGTGATTAAAARANLGVDYYTGANSSLTDYPVGTTLLVLRESVAGPTRNNSGAVYFVAAAASSYSRSSAGNTLLSGTWVGRGSDTAATGMVLMQRIA